MTENDTSETPERRRERGGSFREDKVTTLEVLVLLHVGILVVFGAWAFGGNTAWSRDVLRWWGSLSPLFVLAAIVKWSRRHPHRLRPLRWLWPLALLNVLVIAGTYNPSFREVRNGTESFVVQSQPRPDRPSSARPDLAREAIWFLDAIYLSCLNLALIVRQRRALRALLLAFVTNAFLLAVFGTVQKLMGADGLYFGLKKTKQILFFSSFIYHNHWGAFILMMAATCVGLVFHFARRNLGRDFWHSPASGGLAVLLTLAMSAPLSASRSGTLLMVVLLLVAFAHWMRLLLTREEPGKPRAIAIPVVVAVLVMIAVGIFVWQIGEPFLEKRLTLTKTQLTELHAMGNMGSRSVLYHDTWRMAQEKLWFGWGMGSYGTVFYLYNSQQESPIDHLPLYFLDAHSDWLQSAAELGLVGTALIGLCGLVPLYSRRRFLTQSPITGYLLLGCAMILLYAWLEFPFGNSEVIVVFWACFFSAIHYGRLNAPGAAHE